MAQSSTTWSHPSHGDLTVYDEDYQKGGPISTREHLLDKDRAATITIWDRLQHFTWANFTLPMATGGIALLLSEQPHTFNGIITIGKIVYIFDLVIFTFLTIFIMMRFVRAPWRLKASITNATEGLFLPTFFLSLPTIIAGMHAYGTSSTGEWLIVTERVLFWLYVVLAFLLAVFQYWYLFTGVQLTIQSMTPAWLLPIFPIMLSGTIAAAISPSQPPSQRMPLLVAGLIFQGQSELLPLMNFMVSFLTRIIGLGFWTAFLMYAIYILRMMECGLPGPNLRPGMFISVGPPAFTGLALIGMSKAIPTEFGYFASHPTAAVALQQIALAFAIFIWGLAFWFFSISLLSCLVVVKKMSFHLVWYAFVFPNVGFTIVVIQIGRGLESQGIQWVGSVMSILVIAMWLFVMGCHVRALIRGDILWPGKDEDKNE